MSTKTNAQDYHFKEEFLEKWQHAKEYTLKVASLMPGDLYSYAPNSQVRTFTEQIQHISDAMIYHANLALPLTIDKEKGSLSKEDILSELKARFELVEAALKKLEASDFEQKVKFWNGPTTRRKLLNLTYDHITHHRAQAITYLRMNAIKPPDYIGW